MGISRKRSHLPQVFISESTDRSGDGKSLEFRAQAWTALGVLGDWVL